MGCRNRLGRATSRSCWDTGDNFLFSMSKKTHKHICCSKDAACITPASFEECSHTHHLARCKLGFGISNCPESPNTSKHTWYRVSRPHVRLRLNGRCGKLDYYVETKKLHRKEGKIIKKMHQRVQGDTVTWEAHFI